nr:lysophospholipid acyltransferase family protein [uncultured Cellulosilyticum sp.]
MKNFIFFTRFFFSLIGTIPMLWKVKSYEKKGQLIERDDYIHRVSKKWMLDNVKFSGSTVTVHGLENLPDEGPVVYISNHQGNFDIPLLMGYIDRPKGFVSKIEVKKIPIINKWMELIHCVFMDRSSLKGSAGAIIEGIKILKQGHSLVIFPEGTRSKGDKMGEFKAASFKLATKPGVPIVPITIDGSYHLMEEGHNRIRKGHVNLTIHPPIPTKGLSKEELNELPDKVHNLIASVLPNQN